MDSGNSGSLQSSSGGDDEYHSRHDSISAFISPSSAHAVPISNRQQPQLNTAHTTMVDPLPSFFDRMSRPPQNLQNPPSPLLNIDVVWPKTIRSDSNPSEVNPLLASSSSLQPFPSPFSSPNFAVPITSVAENSTINGASASTITPRTSSSSTDQAHVVRNPKKRSRATRRAPTTVLTTDTTNFRAMVQEFTGIPPPPFTSSSFPRSRLDLFGAPSTMRSNPLDISLQPPYLRRPFPQKVQPPQPFLSSSSSSMLNASVVDALGTISSTNNYINITSGNSTSTIASNVNYQLPSSELGLSKQPMQSTNLFHMENPILTSLLQSNPPKTPLINPSTFGSKTQGSLQIPSNDSQLKMTVLDEFGVGHGHVNATLCGLPNLVSSHQIAPRNENNPTSWGNGAGSDEGDQSQVRSFNGNYDFSRNAANGKVNYSASSSTFHSSKGTGMDNIAARSEGMMETWICSSDYK